MKDAIFKSAFSIAILAFLFKWTATQFERYLELANMGNDITPYMMTLSSFILIMGATAHITLNVKQALDKKYEKKGIKFM